MRAAVPSAATPPRKSSFRLYVEGPRDRGLVETWAKIRDRALARWVSRETYILGGSQPQRAADDFVRTRVERAEFRALCLLDRDQGDHALGACRREGLEFFVWPRRHIESYLLVPAAIRRSLRLPPRDQRVESFFDGAVPDLADEAAFRDFDAKVFFGPRGLLAERLGRPVSSARVAKAIRADELHEDVARLLNLLAEGVGVGRNLIAIHKVSIR